MTDVADAARVIAWAWDPNRSPAHIAFTAGAERQAAYWIEWTESRLGVRLNSSAPRCNHNGLP